MITEYFFKPSETALSSIQVTEQIGVCPKTMDEEVLLSLGIFPIRDQMHLKGPLDSQEVVYRDMGTYYLKCPSTKKVELEEGKTSVREVVFQSANHNLENLGGEYGLSPYSLMTLSSFLGNVNSETLSSLKDKVNKLASELDEKLLKIEKAKEIAELQEVLDSLREYPKKSKSRLEEKVREREQLFRMIAEMIKNPELIDDINRV